MINAYPLQWPDGWPRAKSREEAKFHATERKYSPTPGGSSYLIKKDLSVADGLERVLTALSRLGIDRDDIVISTNIPTRMDGLPKSGQSNPDDPGVAVYWQPRKGGMKVLAVDRFDRVADNLAAVAGTLGALRSIERWGGGQILDRAFTGFAALPAPDAQKPWRELLGVSPGERDLDKIKAAYRIAASRSHPDKGGSDDRMAEVNAAWDRAQQEL
jgi:hypothetical protein